MKLWKKKYQLDELVESFTVGQDRTLDIHLAKYDVLTNIAHGYMLSQAGFLSTTEYRSIHQTLNEIYDQIQDNEFVIEEGVEDIHSQIEFELTKKLGEAGKKIHLGRSRNDQVLTDLKLFLRVELLEAASRISSIVDKLLQKAVLEKDKIMPGYTHSQVAMLSSYGLWFSAYAESFIEHLAEITHCIARINQNPLGSAAGYGTSLPIDRQLTTDLLGFDQLHINSIYAQMHRGKSEWLVSNTIASVGQSLDSLSSDVCLFTSLNYQLFSLPNEITTGSSIMPHKKNPDVFELIRAHASQFISLPGQLSALRLHLISGYHRDFQLLKEVLFPQIFHLKDCLQILDQVIPSIQVHEIDLNDPKYQFLSTVDAINELVDSGQSFRSAYNQISGEIESGRKKFSPKLNTTHLGSIGNLGIEDLRERLNTYQKQLHAWDFASVEEKLLTGSIVGIE